MTLLILGVLLWCAAHFFKRLAPGLRARMGDPAKGLVAVLSLAAIVLMVLGFRSAPETMMWELGSWAVPVNNSLMIFAVILFGAGNSKSRLRAKLRHPMLLGVMVWSLAHLLVNGDLSSLVLFGGLGLWALISRALINRAEPAPEPFAGGSVKGDIRLVVIALVLYAVITAIHTWLGVWPFGG